MVHPLYEILSQYHITTYQSLSGNYDLSRAADKARYFQMAKDHYSPAYDRAGYDQIQHEINKWQAIADREASGHEEIVPLDTDIIPEIFAVQYQGISHDRPSGISELHAVVQGHTGRTVEDIISQIEALRSPLPEPDPIDTEAEADEARLAQEAIDDAADEARLAQEAIDDAAEAAEEARLVQQAIDDAAEKAEEAAEEARLVQQAIDDAAEKAEEAAEEARLVQQAIDDAANADTVTILPPSPTEPEPVIIPEPEPVIIPSIPETAKPSNMLMYVAIGVMAFGIGVLVK